MNEQSAFTQPQPPAYTPKPGNRKRLLIVFVIVLVLLIIGLAALYIIGGTIKRPTPAPLPPAPTAIPTLIPTVTSSASTSASLLATASATTTDRTKIAVSIQNGSGTPGVAQKYAATLKTAGYTQLTTGNADNFEYTGVTIHVTKKYKEYLALLEKDVTKADPKVKVSGGVDDTITTDAEVIIGK